MLDIAKPVVCVVGPTASGKTAVAQEVARAIDGEVVSADSMQIYRGMDIGTGKLPVQDRIVAHHGFDLVNPGEPYSAALFQSFSRRCFKEIDARGRQSVLCGGTGFYVRAAIDDYQFPKGEQADNPVREHYNRIAAEQGASALWNLLNEADSKSAALISPADVKRVVRAFELLEEGDTTYAQQRQRLASIDQYVPAVFIGLAVNPEILRNRIDQRVDSMLTEGLLYEVSALVDAGFREGITAQQAIGYKEIVAVLEGKVTIEQAVQDIKTATHRYAKRQRTWFKKDKRINWLNADSFNVSRLCEQALQIIAGESGVK